MGPENSDGIKMKWSSALECSKDGAGPLDARRGSKALGCPKDIPVVVTLVGWKNAWPRIITNADPKNRTLSTIPRRRPQGGTTGDHPGVAPGDPRGVPREIPPGMGGPRETPRASPVSGGV
jgi:hypothetical protein